MLLANSGGPPLVGIIVNPSPYWPDLAVNVDGWNQMLAAARESGLRNIPDLRLAAPATRWSGPPTATIEHTTPNKSNGAKLLLDLSARLSLPLRPLVVVTGSRLTDVADAYLMDRTVADRLVVVSALGRRRRRRQRHGLAQRRARSPGRAGSSASGFATFRSTAITSSSVT